MLLSNDVPVATHPRLSLQRNYIDLQPIEAFEGYHRIKFRDTPCIEPPDKVRCLPAYHQSSPASSPTGTTSFPL